MTELKLIEASRKEVEELRFIYNSKISQLETQSPIPRANTELDNAFLSNNSFATRELEVKTLEESTINVDEGTNPNTPRKKTTKVRKIRRASMENLN